MPQPGMPSASGEDWMVRRLQDLERKVQELAAANVFGTTGIRPKNGGTDFDGYVNVNGPMSVNGSAEVTGPLEVTGTANFTGNTTIGGSATIAGDVTKTNSWGASSLGPVVFGIGGPALTFTKNGTTYGQPVGVGLTRDGANANDQVTINGPHASDPAFMYLRSDQTFQIASDNTNGPAVYSTPGGNGDVALIGGKTNGGVSISTRGTGKCQVNGNFAVSGTKAFIMDHPLTPDTMTLMHAATESPVNGVEYWGTATPGPDGVVTVELPSYFEALTKESGRNIQLTATGECDTTPWATPAIDGKFTIHAPSGVEMHWLVKAERQRVVDGYDELAFPAEQDKLIIGPRLQGA